MPLSRAAWIAAATALFVGLAAVIVRLAWLSDDAWITLRTVENWYQGHGLRWNVADRVQTFTHPLWLLLLAGGRLLTANMYLVTVALGIALSLLAAVLLMTASRHPAVGVATAAALLGSRAFGDYATAGLENPLVFALLAAFALAVTARSEPPARLTAVGLLAALLATTRMDLLLLGAPAVGAALAAVPRQQALRRALLGGLPFLLWILFATVYYATPLPITAYAKALHTGIPRGELVVQGFRHLWYVATTDPVTIAVVIAGIVLGLRAAHLRCRALAVGALLYCGYVIWVGGDFMGGRFYTPPLVVAVAILGRELATLPDRWSGMAACAALAGTFAGGAPPWLSTPTTEIAAIEELRRSGEVAWHGILDERKFYYGQQGLLSPGLSVPRAGVFTAALRASGRDRPVVCVWGQVGRFGYEAGDLVHIVDPWLCDPLLMRLPKNDEPWRIGHVVRRPPVGYLESLAGDDNRLHHSGLRRFWELLRTALRAPVFADERLAATCSLLAGAGSADIATYVDEELRTPPRELVAKAAPLPAFTLWFDDPRAHVVCPGGLAVALGAPVQARALRLSLQPEVRYRLRFRLGNQEVGDVPVDASLARVADPAALVAIAGRYEALRALAPTFLDTPNGHALLLNTVVGLQDLRVELPATLGPFDAVWLDAPDLPAHQLAAFGGLLLEP